MEHILVYRKINPAEYMFEAIGVALGSHSDVDWFRTWRASSEYQEVHRELEQMKVERLQLALPTIAKTDYRSTFPSAILGNTETRLLGNTSKYKALILSSIFVELPWATIASAVLFFCWYYPIGYYRNAEYMDSISSRSGLQFFLVWEFIMFSSTFAHMVTAGIAIAETAGNVTNFFFSLCFLFCGVMTRPKAMPGFWIFMFQVNPFTYIVGAFLGNGVGNGPVVYVENEYLSSDAPPGSTCGEYLSQYLDTASGYLIDSNAVASQLCPIDNTDTLLMTVSISFSDLWDNFGLTLVYIGSNIVAAVFFYWLARVLKGKRFIRNGEERQSGDAVDIKWEEDCHKDARNGLNMEG
ncbi:uncharacterized protein A1O9_04721 [Exophiala aquamarina CBS 119918]|uniref:ABC-2 type transporter transmembrane domain-containing protein n=1 Tax=Exophiala aquamarina CBS 119918 TaxID=1182545 RepID=A0A072PKL9_9EURO|nr:uncharacterized protein A1O9_04721 [Exophiala aquamarina CBS 119918]KEF59873.1 hypothetical protein A1O9_04721 [Exophiala aquamarina CBS 119918]